jgi:high affinity Mn2+ porin
VPEDFEIDTERVRDLIAEAPSGSLLRYIALTTALLAALGAVAALHAADTVNEALVLKTQAGRLQSEASDQWAYYQAKGIKGGIQEASRNAWLAAGKIPPASVEQSIQRYSSEQHAIEETAREKERERDDKSAEADRLLGRHRRFANSVALVQVSIALGAVAALTRNRAIWTGSMALGALGAILFFLTLARKRRRTNPCSRVGDDSLEPTLLAARVQHLFDGPVLSDGNIVRGHQPSHSTRCVAEPGDRLPPSSGIDSERSCLVTFAGSSLRNIVPSSGATRLFALAVLLFIGGTTVVLAQTVADTPSAKTMFPHPGDSRWWLFGQVNLISQTHARFTSPYQSNNSLRPDPEQALSRLMTIYTGVKLPGHIEFLFDIESAGGRGLSDALGLAGFTNLDVVRNPTLGAAPYIARAMVHVTVPLSNDVADATPTGLSIAAQVPARRIEIRAGKLGMADVFDVNAVGSDSHLQFTNWTVDNNGAYDYAADTRGYTYAVIVEYDTPKWSLRFGEALMPRVANGIDMDWNVARARGENLELELHPATGLAVRLLGYANHANMGSYDEAIDGFLAGRDPKPDIVLYREPGRVKTGLGVNTEYAFPRLVRLFARAGWNEGHNESFAYTEVNNSTQAGGDLSGAAWHRSQDRFGIAIASNGLSASHREYLALGGEGFLLGDGALRYGREDILETYYTAHLWRGVSATGGVQYIDHPGYNRDRGPVLIEMLRLHVDF